LNPENDTQRQRQEQVQEQEYSESMNNDIEIMNIKDKNHIRSDLTQNPTDFKTKNVMKNNTLNNAKLPNDCSLKPVRSTKSINTKNLNGYYPNNQLKIGKNPINSNIQQDKKTFDCNKYLMNKEKLKENNIIKDQKDQTKPQNKEPKRVYETQKDGDIKVNVSKSIFTQIEKVKNLNGKQKVLEETMRSIEDQVVKYRMEIGVLKSALNEATQEMKDKKLEYIKLNSINEDLTTK